MSDAWLTLLVLAVASFAIRASGPLALGGRQLSGRISSVIELLAPALLAALIVVETVGGTDGLDVDARVAGVAAAGGVLAYRRSAMLPAVAVAAVVTAGVRVLG